MLTGTVKQKASFSHRKDVLELLLPEFLANIAKGWEFWGGGDPNTQADENLKTTAES